jgi:tRNA A-37 threonylcarbamoyl transferase component Bud32
VNDGRRGVGEVAARSGVLPWVVAQDAEVKPRHRTISRLRFVAPPGMELDGGEQRQTIGRYEIVKVIGKGAMGVVYQARDPLLDRTVAVKTIVAPSGQGRRIRSAFLERFQREAMAAAKMQHPSIVTIFDVGLDEPTGAPFMVLEYLPGESLADRLDRVRMPLGRGINLALDLASALAFAHRQRIVHRDVKPANVLHAGEQRWKLADFGIARLPDSDLTQVGIFMGTPGYAPPEAIRDGRYTAQADVFAWGAVLYELLSGRIPYEGPDTKTTNSYVVRGDARPPTAHDRSVPEPLAAVCMTALDPTPARRFRDAAEAEQQLRKAWEHCLREGLVAPMALAGDEVPHDRAGTTMHAAVTKPIKTLPPPVPVTTGELAAIDDDLAETMVDDHPGHVTVRQTGPDGTGRYPLQVDGPRIGDDDPTRLVVRADPRLDPRRDPRRDGPGEDDGGQETAVTRPAPPAAMRWSGPGDLRHWLAARWPRTEAARLRLAVVVLSVLVLISMTIAIVVAIS